MNVLFLTFIPSPYRLSFFERLSKYCDLTVLFERDQSKYRKGWWKDHSFVGYNGKIMKGVTIHKQDRLCIGCIRYICDKQYDVIVLSNPLSPTGILAATILRIKGIPYLVECDGGFPTHRRSIKNRIKRFVFKSAFFCLSTGAVADEYYMECGVEPKQIRRYPFSSVSEADIAESRIPKTEKDSIRKEIGMKPGFSVVSVGRVVEGKGFDTLLKVAELSKESNFYVIGGNPPYEYVEYLKQNDVDNVSFLDFMPKSSVLKWLRASDVFIMTTKSDTWGLVINEAIASGLPIISTDMCLSAVEISTKADIGFITDVDDYIAMAKCVNFLRLEPDLITRLSNNAIDIATNYTFESMAKTHNNIFAEYLSNRSNEE